MGTLWMTGLSGSGKSTVSVALEHALVSRQPTSYFVYRLDGDNLRFGLNKDLGFTPEDRKENVRRVAEVSKLFAEAGAIVIAGLISPYRADRNYAREIHVNASLPFMEVFIDAPLKEVEARDPKGLYKKARDGIIKGFTGIDAPYEAPENPEVRIETVNRTVDESAASIIQYLKSKNIVAKEAGDVEFDLFVDPSELDAKKKEAESLPKINLRKVDTEWLQVLSEGWAYPLNGFMTEDELLTCLHFNTVNSEGTNH